MMYFYHGIPFLCLLNKFLFRKMYGYVLGEHPTHPYKKRNSFKVDEVEQVDVFELMLFSYTTLLKVLHLLHLPH